MSIFDTEADRTGNCSTNRWNIIQFSSTYEFDLTAHTCSKCINKKINHYLLMKEPEKLHQLQAPFQVNVSSLPQGVWKVV